MKIYFTVTTDLVYDQRMIRICTSMANAGNQVVLVGRKMKKSVDVSKMPYEQVRLRCMFEKGKLFYIEYNIRLFLFLLFRQMDCICAIDLDTILPCYYISKIKKTKRVYDAHELFCEMKEIASRKNIYGFWKAIERHTVPHFKYGYTVNQPIADEFKKMYNVDYAAIRNIALFRETSPEMSEEKFILYQGAVNEGRCFETLIPAMKWVPSKLIICGDGNFLAQAKELVAQNDLQHKVIFKGKLQPEELRTITRKAYVGVTLFDSDGLSNYYSLANRFFDYLHAGIPQLCIDFPVYREINDQYNFSLLINDTSAQNIAAQLNKLLTDEVLYNTLQANCMKARTEINWQKEEQKLIAFYQKILAN